MMKRVRRLGAGPIHVGCPPAPLHDHHGEKGEAKVKSKARSVLEFPAISQSIVIPVISGPIPAGERPVGWSDGIVP